MTNDSANDVPPSDRTVVRRGSKHAEYGHEKILEILRAGTVAHVGVHTNQGPLVHPMVYGITENTMYLHGALANSLLNSGDNEEICATVTILDGLVIAKTPFNHSMNYRSVVVRGRAYVVNNEDEILLALRLITDHIVPTWDVTRDPSASEIRATRILALSLNEKSAKVRTGEAVNDPDDEDAPFWSGYIPIAATFGSPVSNVDAKLEVPNEIMRAVGRDIHDGDVL